MHTITLPYLDNIRGTLAPLIQDAFEVGAQAHCEPEGTNDTLVLTFDDEATHDIFEHLFAQAQVDPDIKDDTQA